jgi:thymidine phosphorylase
VVKILKRENPPRALEEKAVFLAGEIFELCGKSKRGEGEKLARK